MLQQSCNDVAVWTDVGLECYEADAATEERRGERFGETSNLIIIHLTVQQDNRQPPTCA